MISLNVLKSAAPSRLQVPGADALISSHIIGIAQGAIPDRETAAADAAGQAVAQQRQVLDPFIKPPAPTCRDYLPVLGCRDLSGGQRSQRLLHLGKRDAKPGSRITAGSGSVVR
jgi:hypothetical protein